MIEDKDIKLPPEIPRHDSTHRHAVPRVEICPDCGLPLPLPIPGQLAHRCRKAKP